MIRGTEQMKKGSEQGGTKISAKQTVCIKRVL